MAQGENTAVARQVPLPAAPEPPVSPQLRPETAPCRRFVADCYRVPDCEQRWTELRWLARACSYVHTHGHSECDAAELAPAARCEDSSLAPAPPLAYETAPGPTSPATPPWPSEPSSASLFTVVFVEAWWRNEVCRTLSCEITQKHLRSPARACLALGELDAVLRGRGAAARQRHHGDVLRVRQARHDLHSLDARLFRRRLARGLVVRARPTGAHSPQRRERLPLLHSAAPRAAAEGTAAAATASATAALPTAATAAAVPTAAIAVATADAATAATADATTAATADATTAAATVAAATIFPAFASCTSPPAASPPSPPSPSPPYTVAIGAVAADHGSTGAAAAAAIT